MSKPPLSLSYHNFNRGFSPADDFFARAFGEDFDVRIVQAGADLQISSVFGSEPLPAPGGGRRALRIWYSGEARDPQWQIFDLYFAFRSSSPLFGKRWHRLPLWVQYIDWWNPASPFHVSKLLDRPEGGARPRFCNFIYSAPAATRAEFLLRLNAVRPVDSYGKVLNNQSGRQPPGRDGKLQVLRQSTFTVAFENYIAPGYVTEKILEPMFAGSIPVYWGAAEAKSDFNPDAFIFAEDFGTFDELAAHLVRVADSPDELAALRRAPVFAGNAIPYERRPEYFVDRIKEALSGSADAIVPRAMIEQPFDPAAEKKLKRRLRILRDRLRRRHLPRA